MTVAFQTMHLSIRPAYARARMPFRSLTTASSGRPTTVHAGQPAQGARKSEVSNSRRDALMSLGVLLALGRIPAQAASQGDAVPVGQYLPAAGNGLVSYKPDAKKTPALRAGVIEPNPELYSFLLPASFSEARISNTLTGNFCMPRCDEPWLEAQFNGAGGSKVQLWVVESFRLISKANPTLADIGTPRQTLEKIGSFITGIDAPDDEDIVSEEAVNRGRAQLYDYEIDGPSGHHLATFTVKDNKCYLFTVTLGRNASEDQLREVVQSFVA